MKKMWKIEKAWKGNWKSFVHEIKNEMSCESLKKIEIKNLRVNEKWKLNFISADEQNESIFESD